ncbi:unnamed protein product, partial [Mesorhabditis spiculigera]
MADAASVLPDVVVHARDLADYLSTYRSQQGMSTAAHQKLKEIADLLRIDITRRPTYDFGRRTIAQSNTQKREETASEEGQIILDVDMMPVFVDLYKELFKVAQDMDAGAERIEVMRFIEKSLELFPAIRQPLILKRLLYLITNQIFKLDGEAQIIAWIVDQWKSHLALPEYQEELGAAWSLLMPVRYSEIVEATAFYVSLLCLARFQAIQKIRKPLMGVVQAEWLEPIRRQIRDYAELEKMRKKKNEETPGAAMTPSDMRSMLAVDYDQTNMALIAYNLDITEAAISEFLKSNE